jgi:hypothetical protein
VNLFRPELFERFSELIACMSTKAGETEGNEPGNIKETMLDILGISASELAIPKQIHSSNVSIIDKPGIYDNCDALITDKRRIYLIVSVADCAPVFIYDSTKGIVALVHSGWRGAKDKIVKKTIDKMMAKFHSKPSDIIAYIGPCASVCCYEVGEDVWRFFNKRHLRFKSNGKYYLDLKSELFDQLVQSIPYSNIGVSRYCTICNPELFHSYRREGRNSGRMWALIGLR